MISLKLLDFSPFFLLIFSPLGTADFLMLLELSGDGYSLLCSKKQPPRHGTYPPTIRQKRKKNLISIVCDFFMTFKFLPWKTNVNVPSKSN
jgi:hypothetical protein